MHRLPSVGKPRKESAFGLIRTGSGVRSILNFSLQEQTDMLRLSRSSLVAAALGLAAAPALGQWSSDAAVNTPIASANGEQVQPKIRATADGGCYVTFFGVFRLPCG
jgi:hypothetical protein